MAHNLREKKDTRVLVPAISMTDNKNLILLDQYYPSDNTIRKDAVDTISKIINQHTNRLTIKPEELYLSIDEAVTNAMEHGNKWDPDKKIHVEVAEEENAIHLTITDEGTGFNTQEIQKQLTQRDLLSTRGRGIYIINQFCSINWNKKGNQAHITIKLKTT